MILNLNHKVQISELKFSFISASCRPIAQVCVKIESFTQIRENSEPFSTQR